MSSYGVTRPQRVKNNDAEYLAYVSGLWITFVILANIQQKLRGEHFTAMLARQFLYVD